ncbi:MAG: trigger factor [Candidatus Hydrogenedentota bacterium]|jgi:trigger factor|nr:trigger factor [Candidatus Sumerlaea chitinivorans]RMH27786.1 MAG: trigger factor [Candidatus Hydrogenedentota bacterium]
MPENEGSVQENSDQQSQESILEQARQKIRQQKEEVVPHNILEDLPLPESRRKLTIEIAQEDWERRLDELFEEFRRSATIEGFRKGKAPVKLLQRRFMKEAREELAERILPPILQKYAEAKKTVIYGKPVLTDQQYESGKAPRLTLEIEVKPEIDPVGYESVEVEVEEVVVPPDAVDANLERLRQENAYLEEVQEPANSDDDVVVVDILAVGKDGKTLDRRSDVSLQIGVPQSAQLPDAVREALKGKAAGETIELDASTPDGTPAHYTVNVKSVKKLRIPELDDEFAKDLGQENLAALRAHVEARIREQVEEEKKDRAFNAVVAELVKKVEFDVPPSLKAQVEQDLMKRDLTHLYMTGRMPQHARGLSREEYRQRISDDADQRVKGYLLLDAIGIKENIEATEEDIQAALEARAKAEGRKPLAVRAALEKRREWDSFVEEVRFEKIRNFVLSKAKIRWVPPKQSEQPAEA